MGGGGSPWENGLRRPWGSIMNAASLHLHTNGDVPEESELRFTFATMETIVWLIAQPTLWNEGRGGSNQTEIGSLPSNLGLALLHPPTGFYVLKHSRRQQGESMLRAR